MYICALEGKLCIGFSCMLIRFACIFLTSPLSVIGSSCMLMGSASIFYFLHDFPLDLRAIYIGFAWVYVGFAWVFIGFAWICIGFVWFSLDLPKTLVKQSFSAYENWTAPPDGMPEIIRITTSSWKSMARLAGPILFTLYLFFTLCTFLFLKKVSALVDTYRYVQIR